MFDRVEDANWWESVPGVPWWRRWSARISVVLGGLSALISTVYFFTALSVIFSSSHDPAAGMSGAILGAVIMAPLLLLTALTAAVGRSKTGGILLAVVTGVLLFWFVVMSVG